MTGLELFEQEMRTRGCTESQIKSKAVAIALDIISQNKNKYFEDIRGIEKEIQSLRGEIACYRSEVEHQKSLYEYEKKRLDECRAKQKEFFDDEYNKISEYVKAFYLALEDMETPEQRDALKTAQIFVNSVEINSKYDNTAFIDGLAAILSKGQGAELRELRKVERKIKRKVERI